jgi:outer membrane protein insertion porin family
MRPMELARRSFLALTMLGLLAQEGPAQERPAGRIIRKISIEGLKRLSAPSITAKMKIRIGQVYDPGAVSEEAGHLFKLGEFNRVDPEVRDFEDGVEVIFKVQEMPRVAAVRFDVRDTTSGKPSLNQKDLREQISTKPDGRLSQYALKVDSDKLLSYYRDKGYGFAQVQTAVKESPSGAEVTFLIDEGPRVRIQEIVFTGNRSIDASALLGVMETRPKDVIFFGFIHPGYYSETGLSRDIAQLTNYYRGKGFFEARLAVQDLEFDPALERMKIVILVEEGPRYTFRGYRFEGNHVFSTPVLEPLTRAPLNQPYDEERMQEDRLEIVKYYRDRAYIFSKVTPLYEYGPVGTDVRIRFEIEEGNEIYIEHVRIRKNTRTQDRVIRRELEFYPGEKVSHTNLDKSKSNLARLQIFKDVHFGFEPGSSKEKSDVVVQVDEDESTGQLILGFGVTSGFGLIGNFSILKRNFDISDLPSSLYEIPESFTGAGQTLNLVAQPGTQRSLYRATFVEPYLFDTRNSLSLSGSIIKIIRRDYDEDRDSFTPRIGHAFDFDRDLVFSVGSRVEQVRISHIDVGAAPDVFAAEGFTTIIAASTSLEYNKVLQDRWEGPFQGHREQVSYEYGGQPLGGEVNFHRIESALDLYFPIYVHEENQLHHVIGLFSKVGVIEGHHSTDTIPIFERFFLGGPNSVRGFQFRGLGPHFGGDALGGSAAWYGNVEYVFPLFQKFLRGVVFLDYGNLAPDFESFSLDETRLAVGAGVRINFPFLGGQPLPIGLYLGHALRKEEGDHTRLFLFTIGVPF